MGDIVDEHYGSADVAGEIARFSQGRWAAVYVEGRMKRYDNHGFLQIDSVEDFEKIYAKLRPRSFYATIHRYRWENGKPVKAVSSMPSWDIDLTGGKWEQALGVAGDIVSQLEKLGVVKSLVVKWSGNGFHVHVHDRAVSGEIYNTVSPLDAAYSLTEYVVRRVRNVDGVVVENKVDPARVFTAPLSLHRERDMVCVCIDPDRLYDFTPDDALPGRFKHFTGWDSYVEGEADDAVRKAFQTVGPYPAAVRKARRKHPPYDLQIRKLLERLGPGDAPTG
jgi:DNA primase catalytic subunit